MKKISEGLNISHFMMCLFCLFFVSTMARASDAPPLKSPGILAVCSYSSFEPVSYGNGRGYEADLLRHIAKIWHVSIKFYPIKTYKNIWLLPSNVGSRCDVAIGGITPTQKRIKEGAVFSNITFKFEQSLLVRKDDYRVGKITSYKSFKQAGLRIGVVPGTTGEEYAYVRAKEYGVPLRVFVQYPSESELLVALEKHDIDAIARGHVGNDYQAALYPNLMTIEKRDFNEGFAMSVDKNNPPLLVWLNKAMDVVTKIYAPGTYSSE